VLSRTCQLEFIINSRAVSYSCQELINEFLISPLLLFFFSSLWEIQYKKVLLCEQVEVTLFEHLLLNEDEVYSSLPSGFEVCCISIMLTVVTTTNGETVAVKLLNIG